MASSNASNNKENNSTSRTLGETVDSFTVNTVWNGELRLKGQLIISTSPLVSGAFMETNILAYLNPMFKRFKLAFDPTTYPVGDSKIHGKNQGWLALKRDIDDAARSAGYKVVTNTQGTKKQTSVALVCQRGQKHNESKSVHKERTQDDYRVGTYTADRQNNREDGKSKPQRTSTALAMSQEHRCPFRFNIGVDLSSFFLKCGTGCIIHKSHPQLLPKQIGQSVRTATEEERQQLARHKAACTIPAVSRNIHFQDTGRFYTRAQIRYAQSMQEKCTKMLVDSGLGPTDHFMDILLKKEGVNSMFLLGEESDYQLETAGIQRRAAKKQAKLEKEAVKKQAKADEKLQNQVHFSKDNPLGNPESTHLEDFQPGGQEQAEAEKYAADKRSDLNLKGSQASMIACAWTVNSEVRLFQQFHLVICIDGLQDTNKECRPEITVSIKDTEGKWHVVLRALPPNERAWVFRWLFQSVPVIRKGRNVPKDVPIEEGFFTIKPMKESCINYTKDEIEAALLAASADDKEVPPNMSQLSQVDNALPNFDKELFQEKVLSTSCDSGQIKSSAYSQSIQAFKEHCNKFLEGHPERIETFLQDIATRASQYTKEERPSGVKHPKGRVVSSELERSKKRKAHGTKY